MQCTVFYSMLGSLKAKNQYQIESEEILNRKKNGTLWWELFNEFEYYIYRLCFMKTNLPIRCWNGFIISAIDHQTIHRKKTPDIKIFESLSIWFWCLALNLIKYTVRSIDRATLILSGIIALVSSIQRCGNARYQVGSRCYIVSTTSY